MEHLFDNLMNAELSNSTQKINSNPKGIKVGIQFNAGMQ
jgi:hypothetical protein